MDLSALDEPLAPGLHVEEDVDPLARGKQLAADLEGDLCETQPDAAELVAELSAFPPLGADGIRLVRELSERVAASQRIVDLTVDRAAADVSERLAATGAGVAIHPKAVRERAAAVVVARERVQQADERLVAAQDEALVAATTPITPEPVPMPEPTVGPPPEEVPPPRRWWNRLGVGRGRGRRYEDDTSESTSLLQQMAATTDEAFGARRATEARGDLLVLLHAQRDRAEEQVRVAERAWYDLAGDDPVEDVEAVVQRFDPQHQEARDLAQDAIGVRAVAPLLERALASWAEGWRSLGIEPPASVDHEWVERLAERLVRPIVLVADAVEGLEPLMAAAPAAPVVVVELAG